jgi:hypothetical protein
MESPLRLPSPEKRSLFVFHADNPEGVCRIPIPDTWEALMELIRTRLKLLVVEAVFDSATGACCSAAVGVL